MTWVDFSASILSVLGLLTVAYRCTKLLKTGYDIEYDEQVEYQTFHDFPESTSSQGSSSSVNGTPSAKSRRTAQSVGDALTLTPRRKSLAGRPRRFSTKDERQNVLKNQQSVLKYFLKFWSLYSLFQFLSIYGFPYSNDLRIVILVVGVISSPFTTKFILRLFDLFVDPVMRIVIPGILSWTTGYWTNVINIVSPTVRAFLSFVVSGSATFSKTSTLVDFEKSTDELLMDVRTELNARHAQ